MLSFGDMSEADAKNNPNFGFIQSPKNFYFPLALNFSKIENH